LRTCPPTSAAFLDPAFNKSGISKRRSARPAPEMSTHRMLGVETSDGYRYARLGAINHFAAPPKLSRGVLSHGPVA
jgi:hypothetical protein